MRFEKGDEKGGDEVIWDGDKALVAAVVSEVIQRLITVLWMLRIAVGRLLDVGNSETVREKANRWERITLLCFWDAKRERRGLRRWLIGIYIFMLFTMPLPLCTMLLYCVKVLPLEVARGSLTVHFCLDVAVSLPVCVYTLRRLA